ncbi:hypothetical protein FDP48_12225 [Enterococcus faecalis]|uniref:hypothetical protein n=1 Tax=Enterococcus faecalis TaxID=1351 RepID=UPI00129CAEFB|nr:hypothetical protein [Enterococcus faecalis]MRJ30704.1 hypothetical protein [Enterococcus faecalis]
MNKKIVVGIIGGMIVLFSVVIYLRFSDIYRWYQPDISGGNANQEELVFSAKLTENPIQIENSEDYYIRFDNVKAIDSRDQEDLLVLNRGGVLITKIPSDKKVKKGDKMVVTIHRQFATTFSEPPQILGNSVVDVQFKK